MLVDRQPTPGVRGALPARPGANHEKIVVGRLSKHLIVPRKNRRPGRRVPQARDTTVTFA
jgi:hypothetical protein